MPAPALQAPNVMSYAEFWRRYLGAHRDPRTRALHYLGTSFGAAALAVAAVAGDWRWLPAAPIVGYALAWLGHIVFEHNRPETFGHPLWSLLSDFRMLGLFVTGRLSREIRQGATPARWPRA
jgi:hypothetical protein